MGYKYLLKQSANPVLVSHAYTGDKTKQENLHKTFSRDLPRFAANASPFQYGGGNDTTMRSRSFNFLAMAAVVADAVAAKNKLSEVPLWIPENGFIALNAPLTPRRLGTHSTRTAHPFYLKLLQELFTQVGIKAKIQNPFFYLTKGEMLINGNLTESEKLDAQDTVSCGKWKRLRKQCGRCVPCLIRRASFHKADITDKTDYRFTIMGNFNSLDLANKDDLLAVLQAIQRTTNLSLDGRAMNLDLDGRAMKSGPLPENPQERQAWLDVHKNGLSEIAIYLKSKGL